MDGFQEPTQRPRYDYPFETIPEPGTVQAVAEGVYWVRMPLPFALEWINLWLIDSRDDWTIVDTGIGSEETRNHWRTIFEGVLDGRPVGRVIVTHMHPDHVGLAGWITRKFDAPLMMSRLEYLTCRTLVADTGREAPDAGVRFYRDIGWDDGALDRYKSRFGGFGKAVSRLPDSFVRISDGDVVRLGDHDWQVLVGSGHSPEHACLYCPSLNVVISGDQILPKISSNVSVFPTEPEADPLGEWLASCADLKARLPQDVLVLPAHNEPFYGAHKRLDALVAGHERGLQRMRKRLETPKRVDELFVSLFARKIGDDVLSMATGETLAHLNYLIHRGEVERVTGEDGVGKFVLSDPRS